jgi:hypothetical protein
MAGMNHLSRVLLLSLLLAVSSGAGAEQIREMAGVDIALGEFAGTLCYMPDRDGYRVVATVSSGDRGNAVAFHDHACTALVRRLLGSGKD